jgi:hypothetical protein
VTPHSNESLPNLENQILTVPSRNTGGPLPSGNEDSIGDIDFSDPLWNLQWTDYTSLLNMPGPFLDFSSTAQPRFGI